MFDFIYNVLEHSDRTYNVGFASGSDGREHGGFYKESENTVMLHPFGKFENGADSDLDGMIERFAHEIGHPYDYELSDGAPFSAQAPPADDNPHGAGDMAEWFASYVGDAIMGDLRRSGYKPGQFRGQHDFGPLQSDKDFSR
jgi:hypothetical protein